MVGSLVEENSAVWGSHVFEFEMLEAVVLEQEGR